MIPLLDFTFKSLPSDTHEGDARSNLSQAGLLISIPVASLKSYMQSYSQLCFEEQNIKTDPVSSPGHFPNTTSKTRFRM